MSMGETQTASATVTERVEAPIDRVWALLSDFSAMERRTKGLSRFTVEGSGAGAVRTFQIGDGPIMRERLEIFDPDRHRFAYAFGQAAALFPRTRKRRSGAHSSRMSIGTESPGYARSSRPDPEDEGHDAQRGSGDKGAWPRQLRASDVGIILRMKSRAGRSLASTLPAVGLHCGLPIDARGTG
jgi:hypothetical protein